MKDLLFTTAMIIFTSGVFAQTSKTVNSSTESTTVTINNNDQSYSLTAVFGAVKAEKVQTLLKEFFGEPNETLAGQMIWKLKSSYTVLLKPQRLIVDLDKELSTKDEIQQFERLGDELQKALAPEKKAKRP